MRKISILANGGPEQLVLADAAAPELKPEHLLVQVEAAGLNYIDVYQRKGVYEVPKPYTPGFEGVGTVIAAGPEVSGHREGDRVAWIGVLGSYAEQILVPAAEAIALPPEFSVDQGLLFQAVTAQYLVHDYRAIRPGDTALVHAAAGGVGQLLVQWLKHLGATVLATASSPEKLQTAGALGADVLIDYSRGGFLQAVRDATGGRGVDIAFDAVGRATLLETVDSLAPRGTAVSYGSASGAPPAVEPLSLIGKSARLAGGSIFTYMADRTDLQQRSRAAIQGIREGWLRLAPARRYPLAAAAQGHRDIESRGTQGKLCFVP